MKPENTEDDQYIFRGSSLLVKNFAAAELPDLRMSRRCIEEQFASDWFSEKPYGYSAVLLEDNAPTPAGCDWITLRDLYARYNEADDSPAPHAARALSLLNWRKATRFCGRCGGPMQDDQNETARMCMLCSHTVFPRISPAVIVLVERGNTVLLARHAKRNTDVYTCLAGFVENGETLEKCVSREVREECGIEITNIRYAGSQSWPYPDQLMLAFHAEYESGELELQSDEIEDARWFPKDKLPNIPRSGSVAYKLITGIM